MARSRDITSREKAHACAPRVISPWYSPRDAVRKFRYRGVTCKVTRYIILRRPAARTSTRMQGWSSKQNASLTLHFADCTRHYPLFHYRASISHACVSRVLIIITSYITFIFSAVPDINIYTCIYDHPDTIIRHLIYNRKFHNNNDVNLHDIERDKKHTKFKKWIKLKKSAIFIYKIDTLFQCVYLVLISHHILYNFLGSSMFPLFSNSTIPLLRFKFFPLFSFDLLPCCSA